MAEVMKIATRDSYGTALVQLADAGHDDLVVFDADLSASTKTCVFQKPTRSGFSTAVLLKRT